MRNVPATHDSDPELSIRRAIDGPAGLDRRLHGIGHLPSLAPAGHSRLGRAFGYTRGPRSWSCEPS